MNINRDIGMNYKENYLTKVAYYPVIGTLAGVAQIALGALQAITAIACATLALIPCVMAGDYSLFNHNITHLVHGLSNIPKGFFEGIPLIGMALWYIREHKAKKIIGTVVYPCHTQERKFFPYPSLVRHTFTEYDGSQNALTHKAAEFYRDAVKENGGKELLIPLNKRKELAWKAANKASDLEYPQG